MAIFADRIIKRENNHEKSDFLEVIKKAELMTIDPEAITFACKMMNHLDMSTVVLPSYPFWIEWVTPQGHLFGLLFISPLRLLVCAYRNGKMAYETAWAFFPTDNHQELVKEHAPELSFEEMGEDIPELLKDKVYIVLTNKKVREDADYHFDKLGGLVGAVLILMKSPKIIKVQRTEPSKVKNAELKRRGKPGEVHYNRVVLTLEAREAVVQGATFGAQKGTGPGKALHQVRPFWRTRRGKLELVKGHWRGNAANGIVKHEYVVRK